MRKTILAAVGAALLLSSPASASGQAPTEILNVSYDIARELYAAINPKFQAFWKEKKRSGHRDQAVSCRFIQAGPRNHAGS